MLQKHFNKRENFARVLVQLFYWTNLPTHLDYTKASCIHSSSLILCWFSHLFLGFSLLYAANNLIKLSFVAFSMHPPFWQQLTLLEVTWTTEAHHWIDVSIKTFSHTALPWGSRSWYILEALSNLNSVRPRSPHVSFRGCPDVWHTVGMCFLPGR